jgi:hypothetical protein
MTREKFKVFSQALPLALRGSNATSIAQIAPADAGPGSLRQVHPESKASARTLAPIVHLPVGQTHAEQPRPTATAELKVKVFRGFKVEEARYSATLSAASGAPAALLSELAEVARQLEELGYDGGPGSQLIMHITIRR